MRKMMVYSICGLVLLAVTSSALAQAGTGAIALASSRLLGAGEDFEGNWEYVYDVNITGMNYLSEHGLSGFDTAGILNQWEYDPYQYEIEPHGTLVQYWSWWPANDYGDELCFGSYSTDDATWTLHAEAWSIDNPWHVPTDYTGGSGILRAPAWFTGLIDADDDSLAYTARRLTGTALTGMVMTFRIVHPNAPDTVDWWVSNKETSSGEVIFTDWGTVVGPGSGTGFDPGDVDEDGDIDADDIDLMGDYIRTGVPPTAANYDLTADGTASGADGIVDILDLDYLVRFVVETSIGVGTEYGDFNLDGLVDNTDLTRLATYYGTGAAWAEGNANRNVDLITDTTDMTILATYFGQGPGDPDAIPEPATMSLLAAGGLAALRRRKK